MANDMELAVDDRFALIPKHSHLKLLEATPQIFNKWCRYLVTMEKIDKSEVSKLDSARLDDTCCGASPSFEVHRGFRAKYVGVSMNSLSGNGAGDTELVAE